jgi:hypothetical protein
LSLNGQKLARPTIDSFEDYLIMSFYSLMKMKNDNREQICIIFDESYKDADITILK